MLRYLLFFSLALSASSAFAFELPQFFAPVPGDLSVYYLGAIFGNQLFPEGSDIQLASRMFAVFNQVALTVSLVVVIYTIIAAILNTASEGEALGKKFNSLWLPIRMSLGMALLVPKAGTGYCLAQYLVAWMITQGVGAADTLWSEMVDYFAEGGGVRAKGDELKEGGGGTTPKNIATADATYELENLILINVTCVEAHNANESRKELLGEYKIYATDDNKYLNFGNQNNNPSVPSTGIGSYECGRVLMPTLTGDGLSDSELAELQLQADVIYVHLFDNMANNLTRTGEMLQGEQGNDPEEWQGYFPNFRDNASYFLDGLIGYEDILFPKATTAIESDRDYLHELKKQGWILAGNYYRLLMSLEDKLPTAQIVVPQPAVKVVEAPNDDSQTAYEEAIQNAIDFHGADTTEWNETYHLSFHYWGEKYMMPGFSSTGSVVTNRIVSYEEINATAKNAFRKGDINAGLRQYTSAQKEMAKLTMGGVSNTEWGSATDGNFTTGIISRSPMIKAAEYGKYLAEGALALIFTMGTVLIGLSAISLCSATNPAFAISFVSSSVLLPLVYGAAAMMYAEGIMLGVYLPLIPMIHFFMGGLGWMMASVESVVAAPLVAVGVIFPETRDDIWGRAEPAMMMILNLMLRPSLMIIGFGFAMTLTWVGVELLNILFATFTESVAHIDDMFGPLVVTAVYAVSLITVVSKIFELINILPDKILDWIGGKAMSQEGAGALLREEQGSSKEGGGMGRGFAGGMQSTGGGAFSISQQKAGSLDGKNKDNVESKKPKDTEMKDM